jgi:N-methylhydantoinase A/oxoprolinase/acetone carboxylase beta subunit
VNVVQDAASAPPQSRQVHVAGFSGRVPVLRRTDLSQRVEGPFLVDDADTTTVVPPGWVGWQDDGGNIRLECEK